MRALLLALAASTDALNPLRSVRNLFKPARATVAAPEGAKTNYAIVGCGLPSRGMGWFHGLQLVEGECPSGKLSDIVEPWFLGGGKDSDAGKQFAAECVDSWSPDVAFQALDRGSDSSSLQHGCSARDRSRERIPASRAREIARPTISRNERKTSP